MTSFFEQGFKLLLVAWPEGIALFIGAFFVFAQGITTAHDHPPVIPLSGGTTAVRGRGLIPRGGTAAGPPLWGLLPS